MKTKKEGDTEITFGSIILICGVSLFAVLGFVFSTIILRDSVSQWIDRNMVTEEEMKKEISDNKTELLDILRRQREALLEDLYSCEVLGGKLHLGPFIEHKTKDNERTFYSGICELK